MRHTPRTAGWTTHSAALLPVSGVVRSGRGHCGHLSSLTPCLRRKFLANCCRLSRCPGSISRQGYEDLAKTPFMGRIASKNPPTTGMTFRRSRDCFGALNAFRGPRTPGRRQFTHAATREQSKVCLRSLQKAESPGFGAASKMGRRAMGHRGASSRGDHGAGELDRWLIEVGAWRRLNPELDAARSSHETHKSVSTVGTDTCTNCPIPPLFVSFVNFC